MASMLQSEEKLEFKDDLLTCKFCSVPYDNEDHQAKSLPCFHTYCKACLEEQAVLYIGAKFNCPICDYGVTLPQGTVDDLPNDFMVENVRENRDLLESELFCGSCNGDENEAVSFCRDCAQFLCQKCADEHDKMESATEHVHKLSTIAELRDSKRNLPRPKQCDQHPKHDLNLLCKKCNVSICEACSNDGHSEHDFVDLQDATEAVANSIAVLSALSAVAKFRKHDLKQKRTAVETLQEKTTDNFNQSEEDLHASEEQLIMMIRSRYNIALCNLKHLYKKQMTPLTMSLEDIDSLTAQIKRTCEVADQACNLGSSTLLLTLQNQIKSRFSELKTAADQLPETKSDEETEFGFTAKHHRAMGRIDKALQDVGAVSVNCSKSWSYTKLSTSVLIISPIIACILFACPMRKHILGLFHK